MKTYHSQVSLWFMSLLASVAFAGTTGNIAGTVTDTNGDPLPGVTLAITSPQLIGSRTAVTDAEGRHRTVFLPPGLYEVTATFQGFRSGKASVKVELDGNHTVDFTLEPASTEEVLTVIADLPVLDHRSTESGGNFSDDTFTKLATGRKASDIMALAPGVSAKDVDGSFRINGASGPENQYIQDGVNTTSIELGGESSNLNFDFIQEVQVKTGGYNAEFGRATGGILNVITKSGGNEFEGSVYAYSDSRNHVASPTTLTAEGTNSLGTDKSDYGITLGGPIIKDKLWFFVGANPQEQTTYSLTGNEQINSAYSYRLSEGRDYDWNGNGTPNELLTLSAEEDLSDHRTWQDLRNEEETKGGQEYFVWAAKLTWQINESNNLTLSGNGDPGEITRRSPNAALSTDSKTDWETTNYNLKWNSILSNIFTLDASYGFHKEETSDSAIDGNNSAQFFHALSNPGYFTGGIGFTEEIEGTRDDFNIKLGAFLGNHDLKAGVQYETTSFSDARSYSGVGIVRWDPRLSRLKPSATNPRPGRILQVQNYGDTDNNPIDAQVAETENKYNSFFIQDSWSVTPNIVLNLGIRNELQELMDSEGNSYHKFDDNLAPRAGFTWDFIGDGHSKIFGHYGRFFQTIPMDINNRAAAPEITLNRTYVWYAAGDRNSDGINSPVNILLWDEAELARVMNTPGRLLGTSSFGSGSTAIDPNTKATNQDELILGAEYEFKTDWTVGFKYVGRSLNEALEDLSFDAGNNYIIGNPGEDLTFTNTSGDALEFYDYNGQFVSVADGETYTLTADRVGFPKPKRDYNGYEFLLRKNYRDNYQFQLTYVHSSTRGNYDGSTVASGQIDPGITALFDIPSTTVNSDGFLPQHRRHQFKFDGSYDFDFGLTAGLSYSYISGRGMDALGDPDVGNHAYSDFHLIRRGTAGTMPGQTDIDLHLDYNIKFTGKMNLSLYADIFNLFNFQEATQAVRNYNDTSIDAADPNQPWNIGQSEIDTGDHDADLILYGNRYYQWVEGRFQNVSDLESFYGPAQAAYGKATAYQPGRSTRFGARFRF